MQPQMKLRSIMFQLGVLTPAQERGLLLIKKRRRDKEFRQLVKYPQHFLEGTDACNHSPTFIIPLTYPAFSQPEFLIP